MRIYSARVEPEITTIQQGPDASSLQLERLVLRPRKSDIQVGKVLLVWTPWEIGPEGVALKRF
ncbi:MAG: hypothetical protein L0Z52_08255 [Acidobacteria bacterium]|nr:hypothetical protein [Acidobacteriota bacterium]